MDGRLFHPVKESKKNVVPVTIGKYFLDNAAQPAV